MLSHWERREPGGQSKRQQETICTGNRCARLASQAHINTTHHLRAFYSMFSFGCSGWYLQQRGKLYHSP